MDKLTTVHKEPKLSDWWYVKDGEQTGPVSEKDLGERFKNHELPADTLVWNERMTDWRPATEVATFRMERTAPSRWPVVVITLLIVSAMALGPGFLYFRMMSKGPGRVVTFPQDRSLGRLVVGSRNDWRYTVEARGDVTVPAGKWLGLTVSADAFDDLSPLASLDQDALQSLNLRQGDVGDEDLEHMAHLRSLRSLRLVGPGVTDVGVAHIAKLKQLETLELLHSGMTDTGLALLTQLPSLQKMSLDENVNLTDAGLRVLGDMTTLKLLSLDFNPQLTDELASHVARITSLEHLFLSKTQLTDEGLAGLQGLTSLQRLSLEETQITDEGLTALHGMRSLHKLWVYGTGVTDAGTERLRQVLPGCQIDLQGDNAVAPSPVAALKVGDQARDFEGELISGGTLKLSDYRGKVVLLDFWATWCGPCVGELPNGIDTYQKYHPQGHEIIGISI